MQTPEQKTQNDIERHLKDLQKKGFPIFFEKRQAGGYTYKKGMPDMYIVYNGKHMEIEIKKVGGKPSPLQLAWQRKLKTLYNIDSYIVSSWDEVEYVLKAQNHS